jgi:hypothetical protein
MKTFLKAALFIFLAILLIGFLAHYFPEKKQEPETGRQIYIHVGMDESTALKAIGSAPNYEDLQIDPVQGRIKVLQWGSERAGYMLVVSFQNGKIISIREKK